MEHITSEQFAKELRSAKSINLLVCNYKIGERLYESELKKCLRDRVFQSRVYYHNIPTSEYRNYLKFNYSVVSCNEYEIRFSDDSYIRYFNGQHFKYGNRICHVNFEYGKGFFATIFEINF